MWTARAVSSLACFGIFPFGETIGVQYQDRKARFRVVRVDNQQTNNIQAEMRLIPGQECPWPKEIVGGGQETAHLDHREYARYETYFPVELRSTDTGTPMRAPATDVSGSGCYVRTMVPAAAGTKWVASFWIGSEEVTCECTVRTCDAGFGMGIEFTGLDETTRHRFQNWLDGVRMSQSKSAGA